MGSHGEVVEDEHCGVLPKRAGVEECQGSCDATRWEYSDWSDVSMMQKFLFYCDFNVNRPVYKEYRIYV